MSEGARVCVVGAGIAGLTAAYRLKQAGHTPVVLEAAETVGGRIRSVRRGDFLFDVGAFIYLGSYQQSIDLIHELGLSAQLGRFDAYGAMPRNGKLHFLDLSRPIRSLAGTTYLSWREKLAAMKLMALLARHWKHLNYEDASGLVDVDADSVISYSDRALPEAVRDYIAALVVRGPWLVGPEQASLAQLLWTLKNFFKPYFYGLDDGMDALPRALATHLEVHCQSTVTEVIDHGDRVEVGWTQNGTAHQAPFDACVITSPAEITLRIFPQVSGVARDFFASTEYVSSVNTHLALRRRPSNPATYIMASPTESPDLCGVIVDHLKARGRAPAGKGMITTFCRDAWCKANLDTPDDKVISQVLAFLKPWYGDLEPDLEDVMIGRWPQVVPVMRSGRFRQVVAYQNAIDPTARVQFAGDLAPIGGVNAALVSGDRTGRRLAERLSRSDTSA